MSDDKFPPPSSFGPDPSAGPLRVVDESPVGEGHVVEVPNPKPGGGGGANKIPISCESCAHLWDMKQIAETRNLKPDGTPYFRRERFCRVNPGALFSLAGREVFHCNLHSSEGQAQ